MFKGRKLVTMLVSLLAAVLLWLYVVTTVAPEANVRVSGIPVSIDGSVFLEQRGLIITGQDISEVSLDLSASRINLSKLSAATIRVSADASKIREPGTFPVACTVTFPDTIRSGDVDILRKSTDTINITVAKLDTKTLPIELSWEGSVKEGYVFERESALIDPAIVTIIGPDYEVAQIHSAIVRYDISELKQTEIVTVPLLFLNEKGETVELSEFTTVNVSEASLTLPILRTREITLKVELEPGGGATEENAEVTLEPSTIIVKGAADVVEALDDTMVVGSINLAGIMDHEDFTFNLALPVGITNVSGETEVKASVDLVGLTTDTISVSDIRLINTPEGFISESSTKTVQVTVRGSKLDVTRIKNNRRNGIYILVDLQSYNQTGAFTVSGRVINEKQPQIGVMDTVEIGVVITTEEEHVS